MWYAEAVRRNLNRRWYVTDKLLGKILEGKIWGFRPRCIFGPTELVIRPGEGNLYLLTNGTPYNMLSAPKDIKPDATASVGEVM